MSNNQESRETSRVEWDNDKKYLQLFQNYYSHRNVWVIGIEKSRADIRQKQAAIRSIKIKITSLRRVKDNYKEEIIIASKVTDISCILYR